MSRIVLSFLLIPAMAAATCDTDLRGDWILDYDHYLEVISKGDSGVRAKLDEIHNGRPFTKFTFDGLSGTFSQRTNSGWHSMPLEYQVTVDRDNACVLTISLSGDKSGDAFESMDTDHSHLHQNIWWARTPPGDVSARKSALYRFCI